jgi:YbbR domain-containing protein
MNRWAVRILGLFLIVMLFLVLNHMKNTLEELARTQQTAPSR